MTICRHVLAPTCVCTKKCRTKWQVIIIKWESTTTIHNPTMCEATAACVYVWYESDPFVSWIDNKPLIRKTISDIHMHECSNCQAAYRFPRYANTYCMQLHHVVLHRNGINFVIYVCVQSTKIVILLAWEIYSTNEGDMMNVGKDVTYTTLS